MKQLLIISVVPTIHIYLFLPCDNNHNTSTKIHNDVQVNMCLQQPELSYWLSFPLLSSLFVFPPQRIFESTVLGGAIERNGYLVLDRP